MNAEMALEIARRQPRKITTSYWAKPIPPRQFDWCAVFDFDDEGPAGYGATEAEAIQDLESFMDECADIIDDRRQQAKDSI